jgi:hypothetical protein
MKKWQPQTHKLIDIGTTKTGLVADDLFFRQQCRHCQRDIAPTPKSYQRDLTSQQEGEDNALLFVLSCRTTGGGGEGRLV